MPETTISVHRITLTNDKLVAMPKAERDLLFLAGHVTNELNSLNKVFMWCLHKHPEENTSELNSQAQGIQSLVYARILAGKIYEAWAGMKAAWFGNKLAAQLEPSLHSDAAVALAWLKVYFGRANPINRVRNSFAFHYSSQAIGEHWEDAVSHGEPFQAIFSGTLGNNLHLGTEIVVNAALLRSVGTGNVKQNLHTFFTDVQSMAKQMTTFMEGLTLLLTERALGEPIRSAASVELLTVTESYAEVSIPYFCHPDIENT